MVSTRSSIQLSDLNYKTHVVPSLRYLINYAIGPHFYPPPGSGHHTIICLEKFHVCNQRHMNFVMIIIQNNEVYNVIYRDIVGKVYHIISANHVKNTHHITCTTGFDFMTKDRVFLHIVHTTTYN